MHSRLVIYKSINQFQSCIWIKYHTSCFFSTSLLLYKLDTLLLKQKKLPVLDKGPMRASAACILVRGPKSQEGACESLTGSIALAKEIFILICSSLLGLFSTFLIYL